MTDPESPAPAITGDEPACPKCGADWQGDPIPETHRDHFGNATHFRRVIAICSRELDRCINYKCPDCGFIFDRA
jgi:hypothetical protein